MEYTFRCNKCGAGFSVSASFETLVSLQPYCPDCKSDDVRREYTSIPFILTGKGWGKDLKEKK